MNRWVVVVILLSVYGQVVAASYSFDQVDGLNQCRVWVDYTESASAENAAVTHYRLVSTGSCDAGDIQTSRVIEMEVWQ